MQLGQCTGFSVFRNVPYIPLKKPATAFNLLHVSRRRWPSGGPCTTTPVPFMCEPEWDFVNVGSPCEVWEVVAMWRL